MAPWWWVYDEQDKCKQCQQRWWQDRETQKSVCFVPIVRQSSFPTPLPTPLHCQPLSELMAAPGFLWWDADRGTIQPVLTGNVLFCNHECMCAYCVGVCARHVCRGWQDLMPGLNALKSWKIDNPWGGEEPPLAINQSLQISTQIVAQCTERYWQGCRINGCSVSLRIQQICHFWKQKSN